MGALQASGHRRARPARNEEPARRSENRDAAQAATRDAVTDLFTPEQATLRLPAQQLTDVFLALVAGRGRHPSAAIPGVGTPELVDLFLHGALTSPGDTG
ncbi:MULTISPECIES: hypothetical protein [Micromonospora]|uniref:hypothetical protein n=1 Tax=Micromonospora TaxID=1873 RepID=UPI001EF8D7D6|nr:MULTISPECIES: hypothetical protein [Micromonospora]